MKEGGVVKGLVRSTCVEGRTHNLRQGMIARGQQGYLGSDQNSVVGFVHVLVEQHVHEMVLVGLWNFLTDMTIRPQCKAEQPTATKRERERGSRSEKVKRHKGSEKVNRQKECGECAGEYVSEWLSKG